MPLPELDIPEFCGNGHQLSETFKIRKDNRAPKGYRWACSECDKTYRLAYRFNITPDELLDMLSEQDNKCAICKKEFDNTQAGGPHIDHDHACCPSEKTCGNCIRGLVCQKCNTILGMADDSIEVLTSAINYLKLSGGN